MQDDLAQGDSSVVLINEGRKTELAGFFSGSGGHDGVPLSVISCPCAGWSDSESVENF